MQFTQLEFLLFWVCVLVTVWGVDRLARTPQPRHCVLLAASYYFYAYWDWRFCLLLAASTAVDFMLARAMNSVHGLRLRRMLLVGSVVFNLGLLGFFKYCNFFIESAAAVLEPRAIATGTLDVVLPVGISFFTFQTLSYSIDVYRRRIEPCKSILDFSLYVAFFPQLVAGPIVRATELMPQFARKPDFSSRRLYAGVQCVLRGLVKKVLIADRLGEMVDVVFEGPELYHGITVWLAIIAYAGQIYYDFSGYTDIAIGVAKTLGYRFPRNFRHPYLATSITVFWRRWHMTLSRWLRDYVYISLGGNQHGFRRTLTNLLITMVLGGLWHGAAWTFVLWGAWHGLLLITHRVWRQSVGKTIPIAIRWSLTFLAVAFGWILFRSQSLEHATIVFVRLFRVDDGVLWIPPLAVAAVFIALIEHILWATKGRRMMSLPADRWYSPVATAIFVWCLLLYAPRNFAPFVYFQF